MNMTLRGALRTHHAKFGEPPPRPTKKDPGPVKARPEHEMAESAFADRIDGLFALERRLRNVIDHQLGRLGLTYAQYAVLRFIWKPRDADGFRAEGPVGPGEIEQYFDLTKRTVAVTLGQLRVKGMLVEKRGSDARRIELRISPSRLGVLEAADAAVRHIGEVLGMVGARQQDYASWFLIPRMLNNLDRFP